MIDPLDRFKTAQASPSSGFPVALRELRNGRKRSHWIWYIFPQLAGLGTSPMAEQYALRGVDEARAYLRDPLMRQRLRAVAEAVAEKTGTGMQSLRDLMGSDVDARKVVSSLTLFGALAREGDGDDESAIAAVAEKILRRAESEGLPRCEFTLEQLKAGGSLPE